VIVMLSRASITLLVGNRILLAYLRYYHWKLLGKFCLLQYQYTRIIYTKHRWNYKMHALSYEDFQCLVFLVYLTISPNWQAWAKITQFTFEQIYYISSLHLRLLKSKMVIFISDDLVPPLQQMWWVVQLPRSCHGGWLISKHRMERTCQESSSPVKDKNSPASIWIQSTRDISLMLLYKRSILVMCSCIQRE